MSIADILGGLRALAVISTQLAALQKGHKEIMDELKNLQSAAAQESADIKALLGLVGQVLGLVAKGSIKPADLTAVTAALTADDASIKDGIAAITAILTPAPPTEQP
jgi:multidrug resistance efflux pump